MVFENCLEFRGGGSGRGIGVLDSRVLQVDERGEVSAVVGQRLNRTDACYDREEEEV